MMRSANRAAMLLAVLALAAGPAPAGERQTWRSGDGLYRLAVESELQPVVINRLHRWVLELEDEQGRPVTGASIDVTGGMPEHNHGLPTSPQVTRELGNGRYLLEGMRFHMPGAWVLRFSVDAAPGSDTIVVRLEL